MEEVVNMLNSEQKYEKENTSRIEMTSLKNNEEARSLIQNLNKDYSDKLEIRMTDLVTRLLNE